MNIQGIYELFKSCNYTVCTDTRNITKGALFIALSGANFNGNKFLKTAIKKGCQFAIGDETEFAEDKIVIVDDTLLTLQKLANYHRLRFDIPVLGITGTNGKTTTKELLATVLSNKFNLLYTQGNLNNHIGVPLTLLNIRPEHDFALIEMGANKPGDIEELCDITAPNFGLVTNVGKAHLEGFGSFGGVKNTKAEIFKSLVSARGLVFINNNEPFLNEMLGNYSNVVSYGKGTNINFEVKPNEATLTVTINHNTIKTQLHGRFNANNVLTAYAVAMHFKVAEDAVLAALESYQPTNNRSQIVDTKKRNRLILDAYNANPTSLGLALEEFNNIDKSNGIVIIGEMRELGAVSKEEHQKVWDFVQDNAIKAYFIGAEFGCIQKNAVNVFSSVESFIASNQLSRIKDSTILIKGSRGVRLEEVVKYL